MISLKCKSCGADLEVEENEEYASCKYCGSKYKINEDKDINININLDDNMKRTLKSGGKFGLVFLCIPVVIFVIATISMISISSKSFNLFSKNVSNNTNNLQEEIINDTQKKQQEMIDEAQKNQQEILNSNSEEKEESAHSFNSAIEMNGGVQDVFFVNSMLNKISVSNGSNSKRKIIVTYNNAEYVTSDDLINLRKLLNQKEYSISFEYDTDGYITKAIIKNI